MFIVKISKKTVNKTINRLEQCNYRWLFDIRGWKVLEKVNINFSTSRKNEQWMSGQNIEKMLLGCVPEKKLLQKISPNSQKIHSSFNFMKIRLSKMFIGTLLSFLRQLLCGQLVLKFVSRTATLYKLVECPSKIIHHVKFTWKLGSSLNQE